MIKNQAKVDYTRKFNKQLKKSPLFIKIAFRGKLAIFIKDKYNRQLNNHGLTGIFKGHRSINITGDWRAIYQEFLRDDENLIIFVALGTHSQLYK